MYVIIFITHHRYHSLTHLRMKPGEKNIQYNKTNNT